MNKHFHLQWSIFSNILYFLQRQLPCKHNPFKSQFSSSFTPCNCILSSVCLREVQDPDTASYQTRQSDILDYHPVNTASTTAPMLWAPLSSHCRLSGCSWSDIHLHPAHGHSVYLFDFFLIKVWSILPCIKQLSPTYTASAPFSTAAINASSLRRGQAIPV